MNKKIFFGSLIVLFLDQLSKFIINMTMELNDSITIIPKFFYLTYVKNDGVAWSMLAGHRILIIIITIVALVLIFLFSQSIKKNWRNNIALMLIYGGTLGNLIDRISYGTVRDFLDFHIFSYHYPVFNIADSAIVIGIILIIIAIFKKEDQYEVHGRRK